MTTESKCAIGYFAIVSGVSIEKPFKMALSEVRNLTVKALSGRSYGSDLDLLLVKFEVESQIIPLKHKGVSFGSYQSKDRSLSAWVGVLRAPFLELTHEARKRFIVESTVSVLEAAALRIKGKKLDISLDRLLADYREATSGYFEGEGRNQ